MTETSIIIIQCSFGHRCMTSEILVVFLLKPSVNFVRLPSMTCCLTNLNRLFLERKAPPVHFWTHLLGIYNPRHLSSKNPTWISRILYSWLPFLLPSTYRVRKKNDSHSKRVWAQGQCSLDPAARRLHFFSPWHFQDSEGDPLVLSFIIVSQYFFACWELKKSEPLGRSLLFSDIR